jgi:exo-1,4-beta-D-glucosaminidase
MPPESPFRHSWWYRTEFKLPDEYKGKTLWLGFDGINYRANVWMNGRQIASSEQDGRDLATVRIRCHGRGPAWGDSTRWRLKSFAPQPHERSGHHAGRLGAHASRQGDGHLARCAHHRHRAGRALRYPAVFTKLNLARHRSGGAHGARPKLKERLTDQPVEGVLKGKVDAIEFSQPVKLAAQ